MELTTIKMPDDVDGMAMLQGILYVLRRRNDAHIFQYEYYAATNKFDEERFITIPGMTEDSKKDMTECEAEKCLFVSDGDAMCIHRIEPKSATVSKLTGLPLKPEGLSMTPDGTLLVACEPDKLIELNVKTGETVNEVQLPDDIQNPIHAIKRKDEDDGVQVDKYVVCHWVKEGLHRVCLVNSDGSYRHCYGGMSGSGDLQLCNPAYLAECKENHLLVADNENNRLVLLNRLLEFQGYFIENFRYPHRLYVDDAEKRVFVGECNDSGFTTVYQLESIFHDTLDVNHVQTVGVMPRKSKGIVDGLAVVDDKLYVLRDLETDQICIYHGTESNDFKQPDELVNIPDLKKESKKDMTKCEQENCLFVSNADGKCIYRFDPKTKAITTFVKIPLKPRGLSITPDGTLLVTCEPDKLIELNVKTGEQVSEVQLPADMHYSKHALKREDGQYILCHAMKDSLHRACVVYFDGYYRHCYGGLKGSEDLQLKVPCHLALLKGDRVVVADNDNNRLVVLGSALQFLGYLVENVREPHRLYVDDDSKRLFVGDCTDAGNIKVFDISAEFNK